MTPTEFKLVVDLMLPRLSTSELETLYWQIDVKLRERDLLEKQKNYLNANKDLTDEFLEFKENLNNGQDL